MNLLVLDFESFFDSEYSLSKMTTESYVRDKRFGTHMCGFWFPDRMPAPATCTDASLRNNEQFRQQIEESAVLCHHAAFDGLILNHHYDLRPKMWLDTLSMSRLVWPKLKSHSLDALALHCGLPSKHVPYNLFKGVQDLQPELYRQVADGCQHDCWLTYEILKRLLPSVPKEELIVIDSTIRMFTQPVLELDRPRMQAFLQAERIRKAKAMLAAGAALGIPVHLATTADEMRDLLACIETELQSSDKFRIALGSIGHVCPMKWSAKQEKEIPALAKNDAGMEALLEHDDSRVQALAAARLGVKSTIDETRAERLLESHSRGALPVYLSYAAAKTLRFGGGDKTNWQNFRRGGEIRKSILAPPGHKLVIGDASQVECRGVNHMAGEQTILQLFRDKRDVYCELGTRMYGRPITKKDESERWLSKQVELGSGFGLGPKSLRRKLARGEMGWIKMDITEEESDYYINGAYRPTHPNVVQLWKIFGKQVLPALANGTEMSVYCLEVADHRVYLPNSTFLDYEGLRWGYFEPNQPAMGEEMQWWAPSRKGWAKYFGGKLVENVVQALFSGLLIRQAMATIVQRYRIVLQVHDEIVCCVPDDQAEEALAFMLETLRTPPSWAPDIPLDAEGLIAQNYDK
jgi:hypothetical protein